VAKSNCKRGEHEYGPAMAAGAGIARSACRRCGTVMIDLTGAPAVTATPRFGAERDRVFGRSGDEAAPAMGTFGQPRRRG
jgi:hypothetical protein